MNGSHTSWGCVKQPETVDGLVNTIPHMEWLCNDAAMTTHTRTCTYMQYMEYTYNTFTLP